MQGHFQHPRAAPPRLPRRAGHAYGDARASAGLRATGRVARALLGARYCGTILAPTKACTCSGCVAVCACVCGGARSAAAPRAGGAPGGAGRAEPAWRGGSTCPFGCEGGGCKSGALRVAARMSMLLMRACAAQAAQASAAAAVPSPPQRWVERAPPHPATPPPAPLAKPPAPPPAQAPTPPPAQAAASHAPSAVNIRVVVRLSDRTRYAYSRLTGGALQFVQGGRAALQVALPKLGTVAELKQRISAMCAGARMHTRTGRLLRAFTDSVHARRSAGAAAASVRRPDPRA